MRNFSTILTELKNKTGLNNEHMSKLLNISVLGVEALETGYIQPSLDIMMRMADIFCVSLSYIAGKTDDPKVSEDSSVKEIFVVHGFSGPDYEVTKKDIDGTTFINREMMHGKEFLAYTAKDDAMNKARIFKGDTLVIRRQSYADNGDVVLAAVDGGEEMVRRYRRTGNIVLLSADGDNLKYAPVKIDVRESKLKIIGKVAEIRINL